jgi:hypothetical protein
MQKFWLSYDGSEIRCNNPKRGFYFSKERRICNLETSIEFDQYISGPNWKEISAEQAVSMLKFAGFKEKDYKVREYPVIFGGKNGLDDGTRFVVYFTKNYIVRLNDDFELINISKSADIEEVCLNHWTVIHNPPEKLKEIIKFVGAGMKFSDKT